ncbi:MAG TPA: hypothetical protein VNK24_04235 [Elusimicrobiota bacterium]|nr:hypothetical protein [Elusimicrobiota bacterium]
MKKIHYQLSLKDAAWEKGEIGIKALRELLDIVLDCAERGLRLAVEGESVKRGKAPAWLIRSLDFVITGLKPGSTIVQLEAPTLGETARPQIGQQDLWIETPQDSDTALSLMSRGFLSATQGSNNLENPYCDVGVLEGLLKFKPYLTAYAKNLQFACREKPGENFHIGEPELKKIESVRKKTPEPRAFVVSGLLDSIKHSARRFQLALSDGQALPGIADMEFLKTEDLRGLWGKKVTVKGMVYFFPSGRPRLIEAQLLKAMESGEAVFDKMPEPETHHMLIPQGLAPTSNRLLRDAWGKWPGDESIEDLLSTLQGG